VNTNDTIVAIATPQGAGGIGVVRVSGPLSLEIALAYFKTKKKYTTETFPPRTAILGTFLDYESERPLDHCILTFYTEGASYTAEKVVEISCHGSKPILKRVVETFLKKGVRHSGPGEFTLRAVLAGRLDLTQAEAVNRLIRADTLFQAEAALRQLDGYVSEQVHYLENTLLNTIAAMEAEVDFAEENESFSNRDAVSTNLNEVQNQLGKIVSDFSKADAIRDGAKVVIVGETNAGKSTLFNSLLKSERAIVTDTPGTTRDFISETIDIDGLPVTLFDTAGLRDTNETVEREGIRRSEKLMLQADVVVLVTVANDASSQQARRILSELEEKDIPLIQVVNKTDLLDEKKLLQGKLGISALTGDGLIDLISEIKEALQIDELKSEKSYITEKRQQQLFLSTLEYIETALEYLSQGYYDEVILEELNRAMNCLSEITGRGGKEEILTRIFSSFCIGK
jgi:tRNA modification GTPase